MYTFDRYIKLLRITNDKNKKYKFKTDSAIYVNNNILYRYF